MVNEWDFYKPIGWASMGPIIDGPGSMQVYFECLAACQAEGAEQGNGVLVDSNDHLVFHLGGGPKFVRHAFEHAVAAAHGDFERDASDPEGGFTTLVEPSLQLAARIGPMHTSATYVNLHSTLLCAARDTRSEKIGIFSFGSGAASTMYHMQMYRVPVTRAEGQGEVLLLRKVPHARRVKWSRHVCKE